MTPPAHPPLECRDLSKHFGGIPAVDGVSLQLPGPGVFGLCGLNGAGKSTLFSLLAGAQRADQGSVFIAGTNVTRMPAAERSRRGLARTWQGVHLADGRSVLDNVAAACLASKTQPLIMALLRPQLAQARSRAAEVLGDLGLADITAAIVSSLTLEKQRLVELARAVASDPIVILADEPASGLSASGRAVLADALARLGQDRAVLMVEHDLDMLERLSQHLWTLASGRIVFAGTPAAFAESAERKRLRRIRDIRPPG